MDVVARWPGQTSEVRVDVSVRSPYRESFQDRATPGVAARAGEVDKRSRYGPTVLPMVFETLGRLGTTGIEAIATIAQLARTHAPEGKESDLKRVGDWRWRGAYCMRRRTYCC